jgi:monovalent cation:H+ antiporter-2, CPA2 family
MNGSLVGQIGPLFIELGIILVVLGIIARLASRIGLSPIPFYLLVGLGLANGGILPLKLSAEFIEVGAEIGVVLLLFTMGLEYTAERLSQNLRPALPAGIVDFIINFPVGVLAGFLLGFSLMASLLMGGIVYISSSGIIAKLLSDLHRMRNGETSTILSVLVIEDIAMMAFLPIIGILLVGQGLRSGMYSMVMAGAVGAALFFIAMRFGKFFSRAAKHQSNEIVLLEILGITVLVAGLAEWSHLSAPVGAFIVGLSICKPIARQVHQTMGPLKNLFAAIFFLFFGFGIDLSSLPPVLLPALALGLITAATKVLSTWWATRGLGLAPASRLRAGITLIARGEFSLVIAGIGISAGIDPRLGTLATAYVLFTAILSPVLLRVAEPFLARLPEKLPARLAEKQAQEGVVRPAPVPSTKHRVSAGDSAS